MSSKERECQHTYEWDVDNEYTTPGERDRACSLKHFPKFAAWY